MSRSIPKSIPSLAEFRACVLDAYAPIMRDMAFIEAPSTRRDKYRNKFMVRISNGTTVIRVEGICWGTAASTKIFRATDVDGNRPELPIYNGLPIYALLRERQGINDKDFRQARRRSGESPDQLRDVKEMAEAILKHAQDVLSGDFSTLDDIAEREEILRRELWTKRPPPEEKAAAVASSEAGHAFKHGDYQKVITLLEPHLRQLSPSQLKRLALARKLAGKQKA